LSKKQKAFGFDPKQYFFFFEN